MSLPRLWFEDFRWPKAGSDLIFIADAALRVGDALYDTGWRSDPSKAQLAKIAGWIGDRCRDGVLQTRLLTKVGNKLVDGTTSDWLGNNDGFILRNGFVTRAPKVAGSPIEMDVFIVRQDLEAALGPLPNAGSVVTVGDLSRYSDHLQFAVGLAQKWGADRHWVAPKRQVLTDDILAEWATSRSAELSRESAERIGFILKGFVGR